MIIVINIIHYISLQLTIYVSCEAKKDMHELFCKKEGKKSEKKKRKKKRTQTLPESDILDIRAKKLGPSYSRYTKKATKIKHKARTLVKIFNQVT